LTRTVSPVILSSVKEKHYEKVSREGNLFRESR